DSAQGEPSKATKLSKSERRKLQRERQLLLKNKAAIETAAKKAEGPTDERERVVVTGELVTAGETVAQKTAERDREAKSAKEVQTINRKVHAIDRRLQQGSEGGTQARFHAPSLINPK